MQYSFDAKRTTQNGKIVWIAKSTLLKGCVAQGNTLEESIRTLEENEIEWLKTAEKYDIPIPTE